MQSMVYGVMFKANDVSHTIVCSPLVGIHDRARQNMALYYWQERFGVSTIHDLHKTKSGVTGNLAPPPENLAPQGQIS